MNKLAALVVAWVVIAGAPAHAQKFPNLTPDPTNDGLDINLPFTSSAPVVPASDFLLVTTVQHENGGSLNTFLDPTGLLPLSAFASSTDLATTNANVAALSTSVTALTAGTAGLSGQLNALSSQVGAVQQFALEARLEARRGIAGAMAMSSASMPSAPGRTSWVVNASEFDGQTAVGGSIAHRFDTSFPFAVTAGVAVSTEHAAETGARVGLAGEF